MNLLSYIIVYYIYIYLFIYIYIITFTLLYHHILMFIYWNILELY